VELPPIIGGRPVVWDEELARQFYDFLCFIMREDRPISCEFKEAQDLYYFQGEMKQHYLKLNFKNLNSMNHCTRILAKEINFNTKYAKYGTMKVLVHELDIDPVRKMLTARNCNFAGWFSVRGTHPVIKKDSDDEDDIAEGELDDLYEKDAMGNLVRKDEGDSYPHISTLPENREWIVNWKTLKMAPEEEVVGWVTEPRVLSFDLECYSNNHRAFPEKWDIECETFMISTDFQIGNRVETREGHGIVFGRIADIPQDKVENVVVTEVSSELELGYKLADVINHYDPDVITGYNIQDFDIPWLDAKFKLNMKKWPQMGCVLSEPTTMKSWTWESGGYGFNDINILEIEGRIVIDAYPAVKRGHKLLRYNLDTVAKHFLGKEKCDVSPVEMFLTYERSNEANENYNRALLECEIVEEEAADFHKAIKQRINHVYQVLSAVADEMVKPESYQAWLANKDKITIPQSGRKGKESDAEASEPIVIDDVPGFNIIEESYGEEEPSVNEYKQPVNHDSYNDPSNGPIYDRFGKINWCSNQIWDKFKQLAKDALHDAEEAGVIEPLPDKYASLTHRVLADLTAASYLMTRVMVYCFIDSRLVIELFSKLNIWIGAIEMSSVVGVSIVDLYTRGQQIRCLSQLYDLAYKQNVVLSKRAAPDIFFNGGFVFNVVPGIFDGVAVIDFNSLYPSIMIAYNLCYTTLLRPENFNDLPKEDVFTIKVPRPDAKGGNNYDFDQPEGVASEANDGTSDNEEADSETEGNKGPNVGKMVGQTLSNNYMDKDNYYFRFVKPHVRKGLIPTIVGYLIAERKRVRALQSKYKKGSIDWLVLEERQLALKISANSMFGFTGAGKQGKRPIIEVAMSITAIGRELIGFVNKYVEEEYGADVVYGDSVTRDTPILARLGDLTYYTSIDHLPVMGEKMISSDKEYFTPAIGLEVWSDKGFTPVKEIVRHKTSKNIYRITTRTGMVKVTEDHSLLTYQGKLISPKNVKIGMKLLSAKLPSDHLKFVKSNYRDVDSAIRYYHDDSYSMDIEDGSVIMSHHQVPIDEEDVVIKVENLGSYNDYVYDLETSNHHFAAGVGRLVVHNTDSSMIDLHIEDKKDYIPAGIALAEDVSSKFPPPLKLELEKVMKMILFCKKKYAGYTYTKDGTYAIDEKTGRPILLIRGIILARRDNARWLRLHYEEILRMALDDVPFIDAMRYLITKLKELLAGKVDHNDLVVVRSIGAHYKSPTYFMKLFADNLARIGKPARPGDRLGYLIITPEAESEKAYLGNRMMLPETYVEYKGTPDERTIDYLYYLEKQFMNSLDQLFTAGFSKAIPKYKDIVYRPSNRCKYTTIATPVKMIVRMLIAGRNIDDIIESMEMVDRGEVPKMSPAYKEAIKASPANTPTKGKRKIVVVKRRPSVSTVTAESYN
jgi:DNA polymerase elongation subunit (family B)